MPPTIPSRPSDSPEQARRRIIRSLAPDERRPGLAKVYHTQKVHLVLPLSAAKHLTHVHSAFASHVAATSQVGRLGERFTVVSLTVSQVGSPQDDDDPEDDSG